MVVCSFYSQSGRQPNLGLRLGSGLLGLLGGRGSEKIVGDVAESFARRRGCLRLGAVRPESQAFLRCNQGGTLAILKTDRQTDRQTRSSL